MPPSHASIELWVCTRLTRSRRMRPDESRDPARVERAPHADRHRFDPGLARALEQAAVRLAGEQDAPAALGRPAGLVERAHLLASESRRGLRVEDGVHATASLTSRSTVSGSSRVRQT